MYVKEANCVAYSLAHIAISKEDEYYPNSEDS